MYAPLNVVIVLLFLLFVHESWWMDKSCDTVEKASLKLLHLLVSHHKNQLQSVTERLHSAN